ncbi:hypothetical protein B7463_g11837, partial [Scytalidium lignicola]
MGCLKIVTAAFTLSVPKILMELLYVTYSTFETVPLGKQPCICTVGFVDFCVASANPLIMALQERSVNAQRPQHPKKGPKIKPLEKRTYTPRFKPVTSARRSYTRERKIEVLKFLLYHKVVVTPSATYQRVKARSGMPLEPELVNSFNSITRYRSVTIQEASEFWKIAYGTIKRWWLEKDTILAGKNV